MSDMNDVPEEGEGGGIPEWVVTFGDMMSLLLCFFIMLVSLSEIKEDEKYQRMVDSIQQSFGNTTSRESPVPGEYKPRRTEMKEATQQSDANRERPEDGGANIDGVVGDHPRVTIIRNGHVTAIGAVIQFPEAVDELTADHYPGLEKLAREMRGMPQRIEVRGHTTQKPLPNNFQHTTHEQLAFARSEKIVQHLVMQLGMDKARFRISVGGPDEKMVMADELKAREKNARVEVFLLDEVISPDK